MRTVTYQNCNPKSDAWSCVLVSLEDRQWTSQSRIGHVWVFLKATELINDPGPGSSDLIGSVLYTTPHKANTCTLKSQITTPGLVKIGDEMHDRHVLPESVVLYPGTLI